MASSHSQGTSLPAGNGAYARTCALCPPQTARSVFEDCAPYAPDTVLATWCVLVSFRHQGNPTERAFVLCPFNRSKN